MKNSLPEVSIVTMLQALPPPSPRRAISAMMLREMASTYARTPGGWVWAVAEPVAAIALLSLVFQLAFDAPPLGHSFVLFYATGYLPFMMFTDISVKLANALRFSRPLLAYPAVTGLDALLARLLLNSLTHLLVVLVVLGGVEALFRTGAQYDPATILATLAMTIALAAGVGTLNCFLFMRLPVWERVWQIATRPLFLISGIFFLIEDVPGGWRDIAWFNPLFHITSMMRAGAYPTYAAAHASPHFVWGVALACLALGLLILRFLRKDLALG